MTIQEIFHTLRGRPEQAVDDALSGEATVTSERETGENSRIADLDWATTDSPAELHQRAARAAASAQAAG